MSTRPLVGITFPVQKSLTLFPPDDRRFTKADLPIVFLGFPLAPVADVLVDDFGDFLLSPFEDENMAKPIPTARRKPSMDPHARDGSG
mmetsp:Transcript_38023/g.88779  ORF Transcript_38023/g.88779 Transcript_38023/m.88779 type:complete len:88 (-) Transcript_38023:132-395(-)